MAGLDMSLRMADRRFFEAMTRVQIDPADFIDLLRREVPATWRIAQANPWVHCISPAGITRTQGWKLHVSACEDEAADILAACVPLLVATGTPFKCAADRRMLRYLNGKNISRGSGGKFMAIYPANDRDLEALADALADATQGFIGPFILSDRRYRDSRTVYYRYGGFLLERRLNADGTFTALIRHPDGSLQPDIRGASLSLPPGITDPLEREERVSATAADDGEPGTLGRGRYQIHSVIKFSNAGGVYRALDRHTGNAVVIKEARPGVVSTKGESAQESIRKEFRLLGMFADAAIGPAAVELFYDWEHLFLVEEQIAGRTLFDWLGDEALLCRPIGVRSDAGAWLERCRGILRQLCDIVCILHERGVGFCDLSPNNIMVEPQTERVRLIDFESAFEAGVDRPSFLYTPGYAPRSAIFDGVRSLDDDVYALGALFLSIVAPLTELFEHVPGAAPRTVAALAAAAGMPDRLAAVITAALSQDPRARPSIDELRAALDYVWSKPSRLPVGDSGADTFDADTFADTFIEGALDFIERVADAGQRERLFPPDSQSYATNPVSFAFGAAGTLAVLGLAGRSVSPTWRAWLLNATAASDLPPGLAVGAAGVAWSMLQLGMIDEACVLMREHRAHPLLTGFSLSSGLSGWGLVNVFLGDAVCDEAFFAEAERSADRIIAQSQRRSDGRWWPAASVPVGLLHGASGAALFLLHLGLRLGREEYLAAGREALAFDISHAQRTERGGLLFGPTTVATSGLPYWESGAAGIATVAACYLRLTGDPTLRDVFESAYLETQREVSRSVGQWRGLAGLGTFHLDCYELFGEARFQASAERVAAGILLQRMEQPEGIAFAGRHPSCISCDYAHGMAGTLAFLLRLRGGRPDPIRLVPVALSARAPQNVPV